MSNNGKRVRVDYRGTFDDGTEFDSSYSRNQALEFVCMSGQMISGFDKAVENMEIGETKTVHLEPAEAYGEIDPNLFDVIPAREIPDIHAYSVGDKVALQNVFGQRMQGTVKSVSDEELVVDLNHEMAGKALNFEITLLDAQ